MGCELTVYILNYNYSQYIEQSIKSVINQTYNDFEFFIIDDGSNDDSLKIIDEYQKHYNFEVVKQKNKGMINSINIALQKAKGKYLLRLDADDFLELNALEEYLKILLINEYSYVFSGYNLVDSIGNLISYEHLINPDKMKKHIPHGGGMFVNVSLLKQIGGFKENCTIDDGKYIFDIFSNGKINYIDKALFNYRIHNRNTSIKEQIARFNFNN